MAAYRLGLKLKSGLGRVMNEGIVGIQASKATCCRVDAPASRPPTAPTQQGANFENSILTGSTFGRNEEGVWANLKVEHTAIT